MVSPGFSNCCFPGQDSQNCVVWWVAPSRVVSIFPVTWILRALQKGFSGRPQTSRVIWALPVAWVLSMSGSQSSCLGQGSTSRVVGILAAVWVRVSQVRSCSVLWGALLLNLGAILAAEEVKGESADLDSLPEATSCLCCWSNVEPSLLLIEAPRQQLVAAMLEQW
jgi:hypothetical protein